MTKEQIQRGIAEIKYSLHTGKVDYKTAKTLAKPYIDQMNMIAERIGKDFGRKPHKFSFAGLMR